MSAIKEQLLQFLQSIGMLSADTLMLAEYQPRPIPKHLIGQRLTLTYHKNEDAATGVTVYDKYGNSRLPKDVFLDSGANVNACTVEEADLSGHPQEKCNTFIKTFGATSGARVAVVARMRNFPLTFCAGTADAYVVRCTILVNSSGSTWQYLLGVSVMNHHGLYLWICAFLGSVVMFPELHGKDARTILSLPAEERCKHLGRMVLLPARMTEPEHGGDAMECSIYTAVAQHEGDIQPDF